jgi:uncharacterized protein YjbJ (UPF0337 family)
MNGATKVAKGRIEEATGVLAGSDKLRAKGQKDQAVGHIEQVAEECVRQVKGVAQRIVDHAAR